MTFRRCSCICEGKGARLRVDGMHADIVPTLMDVMGLEKPKEMTGESQI